MLFEQILILLLLMIKQVFCPRNNLRRIVFFNFIKYGFDILIGKTELQSASI